MSTFGETARIMMVVSVKDKENSAQLFSTPYHNRALFTKELPVDML
jgi:hypothetical protein